MTRLLNHIADTLLDTPPHPDLQLCVVIPARNEQDYLGSVLEAWSRQEMPNGQPLDPALFEIIVLANNCTDATAALCRSFARAHPQLAIHVAERELPPPVAHVGTARRLLMDEACRRFRYLHRPQGIILSTDADTRPDPHCLFHLLRNFTGGARAVGGRILVDHLTENGGGQWRRVLLQDITYRFLDSWLQAVINPDPADPWPRHFQHFGPCTAVRADIYHRVGGLPRQPCLEDCALYEALERNDITVRHDPAVRVYTSSRQSDRIEGTDFSWQLTEWAQMQQRGEEVRVMGLEKSLRWYTAHSSLRQLWEDFDWREAAQLSRRLGLSTEELTQTYHRSQTFGEWCQSLRKRYEQQPDSLSVPIGEAIREMRSFLHAFIHHSSPTGRAGSAPAAVRSVA